MKSFSHTFTLTGFHKINLKHKDVNECDMLLMDRERGFYYKCADKYHELIKTVQKTEL